MNQVVEDELGQFYRSSVLDRFKSDASGRALPKDPSTSGLRKLLGKPTINLDMIELEESPARLSLQFYPDWSVDYPLSVLIDDWRVLKVW
ncbi:MAG: hypothetical protein AAFU85_32570 [Planctomycetota bacterium]